MWLLLGICNGFGALGGMVLCLQMIPRARCGCIVLIVEVIRRLNSLHPRYLRQHFPRFLKLSSPNDSWHDATVLHRSIHEARPDNNTNVFELSQHTKLPTFQL